MLNRDDIPSDEDVEERNRVRVVPRTIYPGVRKVLFGMYNGKKYVMLDSLLKELVARRSTRSSSWTWSRATLHRVITNDMGFMHGSRPNYYKLVKEKQSIALQRLNYIQFICRYREQGQPIFYQDEMWATKSMIPAKVWLDEEGNSGMKVPPGTGMRSIVCHVGNGTGFVEGTELIFWRKNALQGYDYHTEMKFAVFFD
ncbi:hypothetical protein BBJ29_006151 [Phytophthora kernoviae]|uniref:Uncharacterized protein n=1 Tax=Phytophthora kernoviae TaxID=325452 RepID=A0A421G2A4_9STRA|nr:hypothetical protein BBJ29_006151 [Phytophthora kernoviae]